MDSDLLGIALNLQKKYTKFNEIYDLTRQIEEALNRNDMYSIKLIVDMRTAAMAEAENIEYERQDLINELPDDKKQVVMDLMSQTENDTCVGIGKKIYSISNQTKALIDKTIALDNAVSKKMNRKNTIRF